MAHPESVPNGGPEKLKFIEWLEKVLEKIFHQKRQEEFKPKEEKEYQKRLSEETKEAQEKEREEFKRRDQEREYRKRKSAIKEYEEISQVRQELIVDKAVNHVQKVIEGSVQPEASYLFKNVLDEPGGNAYLRITEMMRNHPEISGVLLKLTTSGKDFHTDATELIKHAQSLLFAAEQTRDPDAQEAVAPILDAIKERVKDVIEKQIPLYKQQAAQQKSEAPTGAEWILSDKGVIATEIEKTQLRSGYKEERERAIDSLIKSSRLEGLDEAQRREVSEKSAWVDKPKSRDAGAVYGKFETELDEVWSDIEKREKSDQPLSTKEILDAERLIQSKESDAYPKDVLPGSTASAETVAKIHKESEKRLFELGRKLQERLKTEAPDLPRGITNPKEFLKSMSINRGHLWQLIQNNPEMRRLLVGTKEESVKFRNQVFLTIHTAVLRQRREASHDNFGLYERADFSTYIDTIAEGMSDLERAETGQNFGQTWVDWFTGLSNTIRQSRDIDYWASQPGANYENLSRSLAVYQNEYSEQALSIPAVEQAFRALEVSLRSIRASNDGYVPPGTIDYSGGKMFSMWDIKSEGLLRKKIEAGVVYDVKRDFDLTEKEKKERGLVGIDGGFSVREADGHTVALGKTLELDELDDLDPQRLESQLYLTLAKGLGIVSGRFFEYFATSKIPGSDKPEKDMAGFSSIPYEGVAMAMDYFNVMLHKWKFGGQKYFYLVNLLLPTEKRMPIDNLGNVDAKHAYKAYQLYREDPEEFKKQFGKDAKRFIDASNMSHCSSALGPWTSFRQVDGTIGWSDKKREKTGGATQIMLANQIAEAKVKDYLVINKYRNKYREIMKKKGLPYAGVEFDKYWREEGLKTVDKDTGKDFEFLIDSEWKNLIGKGGESARHHDPLAHETKHLKDNYAKAFKARVWVEMAMRNPLVAAHNLKVKVPMQTIKGDKNISLHSLIVQDILGIPLQDTKYGVISASQAAFGATPTLDQERFMTDVMDLEGDLAVVREIAIRENRDLKEIDFDILGKGKKRDHAIKYWKTVQEVLMGSSREGRSDELYGELGLAIGPDGENYRIDWKEKIHNVDHILEGIKSVSTFSLKDINGNKIEFIDPITKKPMPMLKKAAEQEMNWMYGTDDCSYREMDTLNFGSRHWVRRGGDIASHFAGAQKTAEFFKHQILPKPDIEDMSKALLEIKDAYEGDAIEWGHLMAGNLAYMVNQFYAWDWKKFGSSAQRDVWKTSRNVAAWQANERRKWWDAVEHKDILPAEGEYPFWFGNFDDFHNIEHLRVLSRATNADVWRELIALGMLLAIAITFWRAFTAKSEEEEGGGGGGH